MTTLAILSEIDVILCICSIQHRKMKMRTMVDIRQLPSLMSKYYEFRFYVVRMDQFPKDFENRVNYDNYVINMKENLLALP